MIKYLAIPLILIGCTAPVTDPPAHASESDVVCLSLDCPKLLPREEIRGELDLYNPNQWMQIYGMFERNRRRDIMEQNMTDPKTSINSALKNFWEDVDGSNDTTKQEVMLQLSSNED